MIVAKLIGRIFVGSPFGAHYSYADKKLWWPFAETMDESLVPGYVAYEKFETARKECKYRFDKIISLRNWGPPGDYFFGGAMKHYADSMMMTYSEKNIVDFRPFRANERLNQFVQFQNEEEVISYFKDYSDVKCVAFGFPYLTMDGELTRHMIEASSFYWFAPDIRRFAENALRDLHLDHGRYMAFHWRAAEWCPHYRKNLHEPEMLAINDFCYGASWVRFARAKDVYEALTAIAKENGVMGIYLAADPTLLTNPTDPEEKWAVGNFSKMGMLTNTLLEDVKRQLGPYTFSLVEQHICYRSQVFIGTFSSSWSESIIQRWVATKKPRELALNLDELLDKYGKKYVKKDHWYKDINPHLNLTKWIV